MPAALITGVGRTAGIAAAVARRLAAARWDLGLTYWRPYDRAMEWDSADDEPAKLAAELRALEVRVGLVEADLADPAAPNRIYTELEPRAGPFSAMVLIHTHWAPGGVLDTSPSALDQHLAVNVRANLLLIQEFARRLRTEDGRIVALTSDALEGELAYGASKAALDRLVVAAARELGPRGIRANCVNPGANDTGWIPTALRNQLEADTPLGRPSLPGDAAALVAFLLSPEGGWITGQVIRSNGGIS